MKTNFNHYRLAGAAGGLLLAAGQFWGPACLLQLAALLPLMLLVLKDRRIGPAALSGFYMGLAYTLPQMVYLLMPVPVTAILLVWMTLLLTLLCMAIACFLPKHPILGPLAVGAVWVILDWVNYSAIPIWGMAQSFARSWTAYPFAIQFISITGISSVLFVIGTLAGLTAHAITSRPVRRPFIITAVSILSLLAIINTLIWIQKPVDTLKVAAAGWVFDDRSVDINPNEPKGFEELFAKPARQAAEQGARIFTTGEMGFYIAGHEWDERIESFANIAKENNLWLIVGYFNVTDDENRVFFMSPTGEIIHEYTKTHLTPFEPGQKGSGDLKTVEVDGLTVGAMICQDDNFSKLTRHYGKLKADIVLCPTADWWTIKNAHLQAVRARAIENNYGIARGAACGISAVLSPRGQILAKHDHYNSGPGFVIADVPVYKGKTIFARFGHWPGLGLCLFCVIAVWKKT
ncbi:MAG: carbon-nitrogen hydrolase family protein [Phycisphaerae bacterium]|nr:carbon-nitrogen hydrolase family protein [Phycisphaerae bacterium]